LKNNTLAEELNKLMKQESVLGDRKIIPYLGWYWRDIEALDSQNIQLSMPEGEQFYWIDVARKWDYPSLYCSEEQTKVILQKAITLAKAYIDFATYTQQIGKTKEKAK